MAVPEMRELTLLYEKQLGFYLEMRALASEQAEALRTGNFTELLAILESRTPLADTITSLGIEAQALGDMLALRLGVPEVNLTAFRERLPAEEVEPLAHVLEQIRRVALEIQAMDNECETEMRQVMQGLRGDMSEVQRGQVALQAYKNTPRPASAARFVDKQK